MDNNYAIRKGKTKDAQDFSRLFLITAPTFFPYLFGSDVKNAIENLFRHTRNWFSFEHSYFIEVSGEIAGMALIYNYEQKKKENLRTSLLILNYLKWSIFAQLTYLLKSLHIVGQITESECYLNNIAVYPKYRGLGFGAKFFGVIEEEARKTGSKKITLDVEIYNEKAIRLYERLGYKIEQKSPVFKIRDKIFEFFKMSKDIEKNSV